MFTTKLYEAYVFITIGLKPEKTNLHLKWIKKTIHFE